MRYVLRALRAGSLGLAVASLAACGGGSGLLSGDQASTLNSQLDRVSAAVSAGQCGAATSAANDFVNYVSGLPRSVNLTLVNNLKQGASTVAVLAARDCHQTTTQSSTSSTSSTTDTTTSTPSTTTSTSTSTSTPTTTTSATTSTSSGTSSSTSGTGGAGLGTSSGGAGAGNGNANGQ